MSALGGSGGGVEQLKQEIPSAVTYMLVVRSGTSGVKLRLRSGRSQPSSLCPLQLSSS